MKRFLFDEQGELPSQVIQRKSKAIDAFSCQHTKSLRRRRPEWKLKDIASLFSVYFHDDIAEFAPNKDVSLLIESAEMFIRPFGQHVQFSYVEHE